MTDQSSYVPEMDDVLGKFPLAVRHLHFEKGDVLQIALGGDMGDGLSPWIPSDEEREYARIYWQSLVPIGVRVAVTHHMEVPTILRDDEVVADAAR